MNKQRGPTYLPDVLHQSGRISAFFRRKKEWVKLNAAYLPAIATGTAASFGASYLAEKAGVDRAHAASWIASVSAYITGVITICTAWYLMHRKEYEDNFKKFMSDALKMAGGISLAQEISWITCWGAAVLAVYMGASNELAVIVNKITDWSVFIPLYNYFNKGRVKEMEKTAANSNMP